MTKTKLLSTSETLDRDGAADLLDALAERLRGGTVVLERHRLRDGPGPGGRDDRCRPDVSSEERGHEGEDRH